ncbi:tetratricopeptide repeat protein [Aeromicrobium camelliae]|uniref:Tetratricopeptide repeat protein n=1 Tax=Aeromicrobium camelliae TaxID=1538144 RepID=A0A3N6XWH3_9ACTN|nr:tetratricopeptide repeat protein [Aeromicrobium camelliae]RQN02054.1 tetratricopeptide repeat protein [Aeromicrobium camelliae]
MTTEIDSAIFQASGYLDLGQHDRAADVLRDALSRHPQDDRLLLDLGRALYEGGRDAEAENAARAAMAIRPTLGGATLLGNIANSRRDSAAAKQYAEQAIELEPEAPQGHQLMAVALLHDTLAQPFAVRAAYQRALDRDRSPHTLLTAAHCEMLLNHRHQAGVFAREGLTLAPQNEHLLQIQAWSESSKARSRRLLDLLEQNPMDSWARSVLVQSVREARRGLRTTSAAGSTIVAIALAFTGLITIGAFALVIAWGALAARHHWRLLHPVPSSIVDREWPSRDRWMLLAVTVARVAGLIGLAVHHVSGPVLLIASALVDATPTLVGRVRAVARTDPGTDLGDLTNQADHAAFRLFGLALFFSLFSYFSTTFGATSAAFGTAAAVTWIYCLRDGLLALELNRRSRRWFIVPLGLALTLVTLAFAAADVARTFDEITGDDRSRHMSWSSSGTVEDGDDESPFYRCARRAICPNPSYTPPTFDAPPSIDVPEIEIPTFEPPTFGP